MVKHVMIDCESFGTTPGSAVVEIAAVPYDPWSKTPVRPSSAAFRSAASLSSCQRAGLTIDADTVLWWLDQRDRDVVLNAVRAAAGATSISEALLDLSDWFVNLAGIGDPDEVRVWCHGATFDVPLLDAAYRACQLTAPWDFRAVRDTRTVFDLAGLTGHDIPDYGPAHFALNDAYAQAEAVRRCYDKIAKNGLHGEIEHV